MFFVCRGVTSMLLFLSLGCLLGSLSGEHFVWYGMNLPSGFNALLALAGLVGLFVNQHHTRREAEESTLALMEGEENGRISKRVQSIADTLGNIESVVARTTRVNVTRPTASNRTRFFLIHHALRRFFRFRYCSSFSAGVLYCKHFRYRSFKACSTFLTNEVE